MDIIRAWKDEEYCMSLSASEKHVIPPNPAQPSGKLLLSPYIARK